MSGHIKLWRDMIAYKRINGIAATNFTTHKTKEKSLHKSTKILSSFIDNFLHAWMKIFFCWQDTRKKGKIKLKKDLEEFI